MLKLHKNIFFALVAFLLMTPVTATANTLPDCSEDSASCSLIGGCVSPVLNGCVGPVFSDDGTTYFGDWKNGRMNGLGAKISPRASWAGQFKGNELNGIGFVYYENTQSIHIGNFKDGILNGYGIRYGADGTIENEGIWDYGEFKFPMQRDPLFTPLKGCPVSGFYHNCFGSIRYEGGRSYRGEFQNGKREGLGVYYYTNGRRYIGYWGNQEQKFGANIWDTGEVYIGSYVDYKRTGKGVYISKDRSVYVGDYLNSERHGKGIIIDSVGSIKFQGEWQAGAFQPGEQIIALRDGNEIQKGDTVLEISQLQDPSPEEFLGAIENARKNGRISVLLLILRDEKEKFVAVDVEQITSLFFPNSITIASSSDQNSNNDIQGNAFDSNQSLPSPNTQITTATTSSKLRDCPSPKTDWHNCFGTYTYPSGSKYVGEYRDNKRHGQGTYTWPSGKKIVGTWANGESNGNAVEYNADGTILKQGIWKDGEFQIAQNTTPSTIGASSEQRKLALLIGNAEYLNGPLDNPVNDARLIGATLKSLGFEVYIHENANQKTMKRAIRDFGEKLDSAGEDAVGFFYFSGHGLQSEGENYLSPIGAEVRNEADVEIEMVSANAILKQMEFARNGLNIVILDACRTNPYSRGFRSAQNGLANMDAPTGSILAYATAPGTVAYDGRFDGRGDNSPYAGALAEAMLIPNTPVETVFKKVRISVINETDEKQVPWESSSLIGEFMFNPD